MKRIIQPSEKTKLMKQQQLKDLYTGDYLNDEQNENFKIISDIFFNNNNTRCKAFNVGTGLFTSITDIISNFVGNPQNDLRVNLTPYIRDYVSVGKAVFWLKRNENKTYELYYIPAENHIVSDWTSKVFTTYTQIEGEKLNQVFYILRQEFTVWRVSNKLYKKESIINDSWQEVPLDTLAETKHLEEEIVTDLEYPSIFYVEATDLPWVQSELDRIKPIIYSIERKAVMFETQFLKEVDQYKIFENIDLSLYANDVGEIDTNKMWKIFENKNWLGSDIKFVSNKNELISEAIKYEQTQLKKISAFTGIPSDFLGIEWVTAISWTSRALMMWSFIEKIQNYRDLFQEFLLNIIKLLAGQKNKDGKPITENFVWDDIVNKSDKELVEELKIALEAGIVSRYTGIQKYLKVKTEEEVMKEIEWIQKENILFPKLDNGWQNKDNADVPNEADDTNKDWSDNEE